MAVDANPKVANRSRAHVLCAPGTYRSGPPAPLHLGDRRLELEILRLFIDQTPVTIAALRGGSDRDWVNAAHTLKGRPCCGCLEPGQAGRAAERLGGTSDREACERMLAQLDNSTAEARAYIALLSESD